jgi:hypothetical protein
MLHFVNSVHDFAKGLPTELPAVWHRRPNFNWQWLDGRAPRLVPQMALHVRPGVRSPCFGLAEALATTDGTERIVRVRGWASARQLPPRTRPRCPLDGLADKVQRFPRPYDDAPQYSPRSVDRRIRVQPNRMACRHRETQESSGRTSLDPVPEV